MKWPWVKRTKPDEDGVWRVAVGTGDLLVFTTTPGYISPSYFEHEIRNVLPEGVRAILIESVGAGPLSLQGVVQERVSGCGPVTNNSKEEGE